MGHSKSVVIKALLIFTLLLSGLLNANPVQSKTVVLTDVHGDYTTLVSLLEATNIIDDQLEWVGGEATLISLG